MTNEKHFFKSNCQTLSHDLATRRASESGPANPRARTSVITFFAPFMRSRTAARLWLLSITTPAPHSTTREHVSSAAVRGSHFSHPCRSFLSQAWGLQKLSNGLADPSSLSPFRLGCSYFGARLKGKKSKLRSIVVIMIVIRLFYAVSDKQHFFRGKKLVLRCVENRVRARALVAAIFFLFLTGLFYRHFERRKKAWLKEP